MDTSSGVAAVPAATSPPSRRADAGTVRLTGRDVAGLLLAGDMYSTPYDLTASFLGVAPARLRGIVARWRRAGYVQSGRLGPGPAWCWLTRAGLAALGLRFAAGRPSLGQLAHLRAVLAARLSPGIQPRRADRAAVVAVQAAYPRRHRRPDWRRPHPRRRSLLVRDPRQPVSG